MLQAGLYFASGVVQLQEQKWHSERPLPYKTQGKVKAAAGRRDLSQVVSPSCPRLWFLTLTVHLKHLLNTLGLGR